MKEKKKFILAIPTIIIIIGTLIGISLIFFDRNLKKMDRDEIKLLAEKVVNINNISCEIITENNMEDSSETIDDYKLKDNKISIKNNDYRIYEDSEQKIQIDDEEKVAYIYNNENDEIVAFEELLCSAERLLESDEYEYNFIKYETMNGIKCVHFTMKNQETCFNIWLDKSSGMIVKMECNTKSENNQEFVLTRYFRYQLNNVKDEDIVKPNLDGYTIEEL